MGPFCTYDGVGLTTNGQILPGAAHMYALPLRLDRLNSRALCPTGNFFSRSPNLLLPLRVQDLVVLL